MSDWPAQAADAIENAVAVARERGVEPAQRATRAIVVGVVVAAGVGIAAFVLVIGLFRGLVEVFQGEVWAAWLTLAGIFAVLGAVLWAKRTP
ncbi:MAG TPA: hypothetical protein VFZ83_09115 [Acidimicrobiia bacterium]|nr:hypothetical protein [Acidimicrobiia bacterium]